MKRFYIIAILMTICGMTAMAQDRPDITQQTNGGDHDGVISYSQQPTLVYDEVAQQIEVFGCQANYYAVVIKQQSTGDVIWQGTIDGEHDFIDVSFLLNSTYTIGLTNDKNHTYYWTFNGGANGSGLTQGVNNMSTRPIKKISGSSPAHNTSK